MIKQRASIQIFSLSFLDIISCAFGAVVMLILLAKHGEQGEFSDADKLAKALSQLAQVNSQTAQVESSLIQQQQANQKRQTAIEGRAARVAALENSVGQLSAELSDLAQQVQDLEQQKQGITRAAISVGDASERDEEVGGIPVNSDHVIFVIDTSGSMKRIWAKVLSTVAQVLEIHPQVKGFQVLSDNGDFLLRTSIGKWRNDTPAVRKSVLRAMQNWSGSSNSSPVEGIEIALKSYAKRTDSLSIYVFGDDFSGGSADNALARINQLNSAGNGNKRAQIHAIGFTLPGQPLTNELMRFSTLMREVTRQNSGTFIAQD